MLHHDQAPRVLELDLTEPPIVAPPADPIAMLRTRHRAKLTDILIALR